MHLAYTDEEEQLRRELRAYYDELLDEDTVRELRHAEGVGPVMREVVKKMGADGWLGIGWPTEYGGQGRGPIDQFIFFDESMRAGAPVPMLTINSVAPTLMEFGSDEQKQRFLPEILKGEHPLLHRLQRAGRRHRPRLAAHQGGARRRQLRHHRPEDVDQPGQRRRLLLAGRPHRRRGQPPSRHLAVHRPDGQPRHRAHAAPPAVVARHLLGVLGRRAHPGREPGRRRERGLEAHRQPAQPRAGHAVQPRHGRGDAAPDDRLGPRRPRCPTGAGSSTRSGCRSTWPRPTPGSSSCASPTGRWPGTPPEASSTWPTPAPSRSSAPSTTSSRSACSWRCWASAPT